MTPIKENGRETGYTITFTRSAPITIYHGADGRDGQDGYTPDIGLKTDTDGDYYWTLDGEWMRDSAGDKIPARGPQGEAGEAGKDGLDGITPQFRIEEGYWYISYDSGESWTRSEKAQGEQGAAGADVKDETAPQLKILESYWYVSYDNGENWTKLTRARGDNGTEGVTPRLKIEDNYWYISYDNGKSFEGLGGATGAQGPQGPQGPAGLNGDSFFSDVRVGDAEISFVLSDGTTFTIQRGPASPIEFTTEGAQEISAQANTVTARINVAMSGIETVSASIEAQDDVYIPTRAAGGWKAALAVDEQGGTITVTVTPDRTIKNVILTITVILKGRETYKIAKVLKYSNKYSAEREALEALYRATGGDGWTRKDSWNSPTAPISDFYDIRTNSEGKVTEISLNNNNLTGSISAGILRTFTELQVLYVGNNALTSLDLSTNLVISDLWCYSNSLTQLNISHLQNLTSLIVGNQKDGGVLTLFINNGQEDFWNSQKDMTNNANVSISF